MTVRSSEGVALEITDRRTTKLPLGRTKISFTAQSRSEAQEYMKCIPCPPLPGETLKVEWDAKGMTFTIWSEPSTPVSTVGPEVVVNTGKMAELMAKSTDDLLTGAAVVGVKNAKFLLKQGKHHLVAAMIQKMG